MSLASCWRRFWCAAAVANRRSARAARHVCEAVAAQVLFGLLGALPVGWASALGAALGGCIGPLLPVHRQGLDNLAPCAAGAFAGGGPARVRGACGVISVASLRNTRILHRFSVDAPGGRIELVGRAHLDEARRSPTGGIFVSGHIGNWEVCVPPLEQSGIPVTVVYRAANNPIVDRMIARFRSAVMQHRVPKGHDGTRELVRSLGAGKHVALLVDQKHNTGIPVPFFGRDAMTAPAVATFALRYDCPIWPVRVERLGGVAFRATIYPKLAVPEQGTREERIHATMVAINRILEGWIRERPEQWLWLHRRWPE